MERKDLERLMSHNIQDFTFLNDLMTIFAERSRPERVQSGFWGAQQY